MAPSGTLTRSASSLGAAGGGDLQAQTEDVRARAKAFVKELQAANQEAKEKICQKLAVFAHDEAAVRVLLLSGALKPLVATVEGGFDGGQTQASAALIVKAGGVAPLVRMLQQRHWRRHDEDIIPEGEVRGARDEHISAAASSEA